MSDTFKSLFLKEECFDFIVTHFSYLKDTSEYQSLPSELKAEIFEYITSKQNLQANKNPHAYGKKPSPHGDGNFNLL